MKLYIISSETRFFLSHRLPIALKAKALGYKITIIAKDTGEGNQIKEMGFDFVELPVNPTGMNPIEEFKTFRFLYNSYKKNKPDIIHHVGLKYILWGTLAAKFTKSKNVLNAVCGLGGLFNGERLSAVAKGILKMMSFSNQDSSVWLFQNTDDKDILLSNGVITETQIEFTNGSGINLNDFKFCRPINSKKIKIIFTARLVKEKGVTDLIEAAEILKDKYSNKIEFIICGRLTPNKTGITEEYMNLHCDGKYINWLGERSDIKELLGDSHIMAFPSYYREGLPKSLIEATAVGLPIITCDSVGCRDAVKDGINGFLIPPQAPVELAKKLEILINDDNLRDCMGKESRILAEKKFSIDEVVKKHIDIYNSFNKN